MKNSCIYPTNKVCVLHLLFFVLLSNNHVNMVLNNFYTFSLYKSQGTIIPNN